jgi:hypothetical protein
MPQTPLRQTRRQRACIFCGATKKITEEHVFSKWMKKYLPANDWHTFHELRSGRQDSFGQSTFGNWRRSTNSVRPAVVCQSCNNGWMSKIETQVKESFIVLMSGQSFILTTEHQYKISRWAVLKTMIYEYNVDGPKVSSREDLYEFQKNVDISPQWGIWIAKCQAPNWRLRIMRQSTFLGTTPIIIPPPPNVQFLTVALNNLLLHVRQNKVTAISPPPSPGSLFQIWPTRGNIVWPPARILNATEAEVIGTGLFRWLGMWPPPAYGLPPDGSRTAIRRE